MTDPNPPVRDPMIMPRAEALLECLAVELAKVEFPPANVQLRAGTVVDHLISSAGRDECCEGLGWVRVAGFYPSSGVFPAQDEAPTPKGVTGWVITLEMGAIRCAPTPDASAIPSGQEWTDLTQKVMDDAAAMRRAICCYTDWQKERYRTNPPNILPGQWQPISIEGGCTGGILPVQIRAGACDC